jgi:hypothetical protein
MSMNEQVRDEAEALLTQAATAELLGAALRGDRRGMRQAVDHLAALVPGGERREILVLFVRHLIVVAGGFGGVSVQELGAAIEIIERLSIEALEAYAHKFAWLAYPGGPSGPALTMN